MDYFSKTKCESLGKNAPWKIYILLAGLFLNMLANDVAYGHHMWWWYYQSNEMELKLIITA